MKSPIVSTPIVNVHKDVMSNEECQKLIATIKQKNVEVVLTGENNGFFTGKVCHFDINDPFILQLEQRLSTLVSQPINTGEKLVGMYYKEGEFFKLHTNYFEEYEYEKFCKEQGNRLKTLIIFLNTMLPEEGGSINFPFLNKAYIPQEGWAIEFDNLKDGVPNFGTLHEVTSITKDPDLDDEPVCFMLIKFFKER